MITKGKEEKRFSSFNPLAAHQGIRSNFSFLGIKFSQTRSHESKAQELLREEKKNCYCGVLHLHKEAPEDNSSQARCSPTVKLAALFKSYLTHFKASNKTYKTLPRGCMSFNSFFSEHVLQHDAHSHSILKDVTQCKAEANLDKTRCTNQLVLGQTPPPPPNKPQLLCLRAVKQVFSRSSVELSGSSEGSQLVISVGSAQQRRCVWLSTGALK